MILFEIFAFYFLDLFLFLVPAKCIKLFIMLEVDSAGIKPATCRLQDKLLPLSPPTSNFMMLYIQKFNKAFSSVYLPLSECFLFL